MVDWNNFHGCKKLYYDECVYFLIHLENSGRIETEEGSFLHNQYIRELLSERGIKVNTLPPRRESMTYYNPDRLRSEIKDIENNYKGSLLTKGYKIMSFRSALEAAEERPVSVSITDMKKTVQHLRHHLMSNKWIENVIRNIVFDKLSILMLGDYELLNKTYVDNFVRYDIRLYDILERWLNGEAMENHDCGDCVYVYGITEVKELSCIYKWRGYCLSCGITSGESHIKNWVNEEKKKIGRTNEFDDIIKLFNI